MGFKKIQWHRWAGGAFIAAFALLLFFRLDPVRLFRSVPETVGMAVPVATDPLETWFVILQHGRKIGYAKRTLSPTASGSEFFDEIFMRINTMGVVQGITLKMGGTLHPDMTLSTFHARLTSNLFRFVTRGTVVGRQLTFSVGEGMEEKKYRVLLAEPPHMAAHLSGAVLRSGLKPGEVKRIHLFDPMGMGSRSVVVSSLGQEGLPASGESRRFTKLAVDFLGTRQYAWVDSHGHVVREEGMLGMVLERVDRDTALQVLRSDAASGDMTELASVASNRVIPAPSDLDTLSLRLGSVGEGRFALDGGRQSYRNGVLTIDREFPVTGERGREVLNTGERAAALKPSPLVQSDHPRIRETAGGILSPGDSREATIRKIVRFVHGHLEKQPVLSVSNALETLEHRKGDCTEHAVLAAALGRAAGIPTVIETGLVYQKGRFYYHAWNAFWIEEWSRWITADAVFDQVPADVTHIRLIRGEIQDQIDLISLLGRVSIEVLP